MQESRDSAGRKGSYKLYVEVGVVYSPGGAMELKSKPCCATSRKKPWI